MLREITASKRTEGAFERRWYQDDQFDLYVWFDNEGAITHFQLAYDKPTVEKALDWKHSDGFMHYRVNQYVGEAVGSLTPLLILDPVFPKQRVIHHFDGSSSGIDIGVAAFVSRMLRRAPSVYYKDDKMKWPAAGVLAGALFLIWRIFR
ncbi:MAG: hypothetical protein JWN94_1358 [Betaproteobacteria bacterium]|nr:hypothetical protein [Betaproteobacteria bacterium]